MRNFLNSYKIKKYGSSKIDSVYLHSWCVNHSVIPDSDDTMFVVDYKLKLQDLDPKRQKIDIFLSTKRLLSQSKRSNMVQIDATYKLVWEGYPIFVLGSTDQNRVFHPFGISVSGGESELEFSFVFDAIKKIDPTWNPDYLLSDCSDAILLGFKNSLGLPERRLLCFFHVMKNFKENLPKNQHRDEIISDIHHISSSTTDSMFSISVQLFLNKWKYAIEPSILKFLKYFEDYYVKRHPFWYYGSVVGLPTTNNGIEGTNSLIKSQHTFRSRWPLKDFLKGLNTLVDNWSYDKNPSCPNYKPFSDIYLPSTSEWTSAFNWNMDQYTILEKREESVTSYFSLSKKLGRDESLLKIKSYMEKMYKWDSFEEFVSFRKGIVIVTENFSTPGTFTCNCMDFLKNNSCYHSIGFRIRKFPNIIPEEAKSIVVGAKLPRGRRSLSKKAWIRQ